MIEGWGVPLRKAEVQAERHLSSASLAQAEGSWQAGWQT